MRARIGIAVCAALFVACSAVVVQKSIGPFWNHCVEAIGFCEKKRSESKDEEVVSIDDHEGEEDMGVTIWGNGHNDTCATIDLTNLAQGSLHSFETDSHYDLEDIFQDWISSGRDVWKFNLELIPSSWSFAVKVEVVQHVGQVFLVAFPCVARGCCEGRHEETEDGTSWCPYPMDRAGRDVLLAVNQVAQLVNRCSNVEVVIGRTPLSADYAAIQTRAYVTMDQLKWLLSCDASRRCEVRIERDVVDYLMRDFE